MSSVHNTINFNNDTSNIKTDISKVEKKTESYKKDTQNSSNTSQKAAKLENVSFDFTFEEFNRPFKNNPSLIFIDKTWIKIMNKFSDMSKISFSKDKDKIIIEEGINFKVLLGYVAGNSTNNVNKFYALRILNKKKSSNEKEQKNLKQLVDDESKFNLNIKNNKFTSCFGVFYIDEFINVVVK